MASIKTIIRNLLTDVVQFTQHASSLELRDYQQDVARSIVDSVVGAKGLTIVVVFPRQSGKNELQAQVETYLLSLFSKIDCEIVKVSPTWKPQSINAMRRLERVLERNIITRVLWSKESGYIYKVGLARIFFLSGSPTANVVGATASLLLECDEAQDVQITKWDKEINPMAASTNATKVYWGTAWTSQTLLAREKRLAKDLQDKDGIRRVFEINADDVRLEVPEYGTFVDQEIAKLGRSHPFVRTQYFSEEIDAEGGMFPPDRLAKMQANHEPRLQPEPGLLYAFLIDIAGEDEAASQSPDQTGIDGGGALKNPNRDSTALTIVEVDLSTLADDLIKAPRYLVRQRQLWTGTKHTDLYARIKDLAETWGPRYIVVDATGVGVGLSSFLDKAFPGQVLPFIFTGSSKSSLGWDFLSVIETGRYKEYALTPATPSVPGGGAAPTPASLQSLFYRQCRHAQMEILPGPERRMRWGVPEGMRDEASGELLHDDLLISAALCALLDEQEWGTAVSEIISPLDPIDDLSF